MSTHGVALTTQEDPDTTISIARILCGETLHRCHRRVHRARRAPIDMSARIARLRAARRHVASTGHVRKRTRPARAVPASSPLSAIDLLERIDLEIALGKDAFELGVLAFECSQSLDIGRFKAGEMTTPVVDRLLADLVSSAPLRRPATLSASRKIATICSSLNRTFFMVSSPLAGAILSTCYWSEKPGQVTMATVRKYQSNWVADYVDQHGKRHRERPQGKFDSLGEQRRAAQSLLKKRLDEVDGGSFDVQSKTLTFDQAAEFFLASKISIRSTTRRGYESLIGLYLTPYFGPRRIGQISAADVERYRNDLMRGWPSPIADAFAKRLMTERPGLSRARAMQRIARKKPGLRTISKSLTVAAMIFNFCCKHRWTDFNPVSHVERPKAEVAPDADPIDGNVLSPAEIVRLIGSSEGPRRNQSGELIGNNYRLMIKFALLTGVRSGELRGLKWEHIDWHSQQIHVRRSWKENQFFHPKTAASNRRIPLAETLVSELREWRLACPKSQHGLVFANLSGNPMSNPNLLQRGFYPALRRAGLRQIRFHDLRHTFASLMIANGEDIVRVSRLLGHANPAITLKVYSHAMPRDHYGSPDRLSDLVFGAAEDQPGPLQVLLRTGKH